MKTTFKIILGWLIAIPFFLLGQANRSMTFFNGYYGAPPADSIYYNNMWIERRDTGLFFSERVFSEYDFKFSQSSTYCDLNGKPILLWQGCYLLDAKTLKPIENGDLSNGPGAKKDYMDFCKIKKYPFDTIGNGVINGYSLTYSTFFLNRGNDEKVLLVYYRFNDPPYFTVSHIYTALIDLKGSTDGGPTVIYKDSIQAPDVILRIGSINAIRHANGYDWHIVFAEKNSNNWYSILYDKNGLNLPIKSTIKQWDNNLVDEGTSTISPDGSKYVFHSNVHQFMIMDFDRCSGKFRYFKDDEIPNVDGNVNQFHWSEFSPNGRFLYLNNPKSIYQYDLNENDFYNSRVLIAEFDTSQINPLPIKGYFSMLLRGFDNKIYYWSYNTSRYVHRIAFPDQKGPDVGWTQDYYKTPIYPTWYIPTLIDYGMGPLEGSPCISSINDGSNKDFVSFYPNPANDFVRAFIDQKYEKATVLIYDVTGRLMYHGNVAQLRIGMNISSWAAGTYIVQVNGRQAGKFAKI
ncbi:MAG: T9SS type A sorting domain-containing protein [Saprospiraceae bacterium]